MFDYLKVNLLKLLHSFPPLSRILLLEIRGLNFMFYESYLKISWKILSPNIKYY